MPFADREARRRYQRDWMERRRREWFAEHGPCVLCGSWDQLELDHIDPDQKVTHRVWSWSSERRNAELAKCQVLCHRCHKRKTIEMLEVPTPHGTHSGYAYHGCRCPACVQAHAAYERTRREGR